MTTRYGASPEDWQILSQSVQGDLLPVVSNPHATISPNSKMKSLGKTPSGYNNAKQVVGIAKWTEMIATPERIAKWAAIPDYGICIQSRYWRALDVDVLLAAVAEEIEAFIRLRYDFPKRFRSTSSKFLMTFALEGEYPKRSFKTNGGIVEFLGNGNQFVASGAHIDKDGVSRSRYEWEGGLPTEVPVLTPDEFEALWNDLVDTFAIEPPTIGTGSSKAQKLSDAARQDPVALYLLDHGHVRSTERDGRLHITCPFEADHTTDSAESATTYFPAHTGGYEQGHFVCLHAHCEHKTDEEFKIALGAPSVLDDFESLAKATAEKKKEGKFTAVPAHEFVEGRAASWIVKNVLPRADIGVLYGDWSAGKTFAVLDMMVSIALGEDWRGHKVEQGTVVFITAEGTTGMRNRLKAISLDRGIDLEHLPIYFIAAAPNLLLKEEALAVSEAIIAIGGASVVVVDTFAQTTPGADENSGKDVGKALDHCKGIKIATGGMVLLIHHAGKDSGKGPRGWSGILGNVDVAFEVRRDEDRRELVLTKLKDGQFPQHFGFELEPVTIGIDDDDEIIESCVVRHRHDALRPKPKKIDRDALHAIVKETLVEMDNLSGIDITDFMPVVVERIFHDPESRDDRRQRVLKMLERMQLDNEVTKEGTKIFLVNT